jgi:hypothetical protein
MSKLTIFRILTLLVCAFAFSSIAQAQATRTWVSGVGDDLNPCSRTAPCKTFAGAISKTFINGEINCLDPGGYGAVTKSIMIDCEDTQGSILASSVNGIIINLGAANANDPLRTVRLRGLSINGAGSQGSVGTRTGIRGIDVSTSNTSPVKLFIEELIVFNFVNEGLRFRASGGELVVNDSEFIDNGLSGILVDSNSAVNDVEVSIDNTHTDLNQQGVRFEDNVKGHIRNSTASNNTLNGYVCNPGTTSSNMTIDNSSATDNEQFGVFAGGAGGVIGTVRISGITAVENNTSQLEIVAPGVMCTNQKNHIAGPTDAPGACFLDS